MKLEPICLPIREDLKKVEAFIQSQIHSAVPLVTDVAEYVIQNGGKRIRPILCLLAARLAGFSGERAIQSAAALEFMHTASLLHDDVIDNAEIRRGKSSANSRWGNQVSVLVGDFFYCRVCDIFVSQKDLRLLKLITQTMVQTTEGEVLEIAASNNPELTEDQYLEIIKNKTA
ncbi:MAG: polyprenyl synthetase family protein, partial [bacterium]|nr:polyprenyl synthetase family protein [bacterium]